MRDGEDFGQIVRPLFEQCCCTKSRWAGEPKQGTTRDQPSQKRSSLLGGLWLSLRVWTMPSAHLSGYRSPVCLVRRPSPGCINVFNMEKMGHKGEASVKASKGWRG